MTVARHTLQAGAPTGAAAATALPVSVHGEEQLGGLCCYVAQCDASILSGNADELLGRRVQLTLGVHTDSPSESGAR